MESTVKEFADWTEYDDWLVENYSENSVFSVNESDGKIKIEYCSKEEFARWKKEQEALKENK
ncbi:MAG: hypothetical protein J6Y93_03410 [Treponema sp.]|nr:hypothetical protein [Treponema sp.]